MGITMIIPSTIFLLTIIFTSSCYSDCDSFYMHQYNEKFEQSNKRFWEFNEVSNSWVEVALPYDIVSCIDGNCTVVNSIQDDWSAFVGVRKRISLTQMSETSVWVTGESGSIYERFWNGLQWVIAPHDLPPSAGYAISVFMVNQTILALSQQGLLYQMQLTEDSQPIWVEFLAEEMVQVRVSSGVVSKNRERIYFCTRNGLLFELIGIDPPRWEKHGRPPGANVTAISDGATIRPRLLLIISGAGDLYEYDQTSKPPWKKHIRSTKHTSLASFSPCGIPAPHSSISIFLLTKKGELIERRLHRNKWKWVLHGNPKDHLLTSITCTSNPDSLLLTTAAGFVFEYQLQRNEDAGEKWVNHNHPPNAKVARAIPGLQLQLGRTIFPLDDGRLAELHLPGFGGEASAPITTRRRRKRRSLLNYVWSFLDAPESEGWNTEYCTEERGPYNCIFGTKDEMTESSTWRKDGKTQHNYLTPEESQSESESESESDGRDYDTKLFRLRVMQEGKSFFLITDNYITFEYLNTENAWFWLRHEHSTRIHGALGNYNGSLFVVDEFGSLLIRERSSSSDLAWINCTSMRKGRQVVGGPPWDGIVIRPKPEDAIFFVSTTGKLLQYTVALRKFKWKDCNNPAGIKIASIVDQEGFRENIVFVVGHNGRLYQYNKVTQVWHQHYQSQHLVLSTSPGTAMRPSTGSLRGSLFMLSRDGGLVEYHWTPTDGWNWIEHGTPHTSVPLVGAPGPCFGGTHLFLIGSDGNVYLRYFDQHEWKWSHCGFPFVPNKVECVTNTDSFHHVGDKFQAADDYCNPKVSSTRPIPFSQDTVIFELQDGRLGEMRRMDDKNWMWSRIIGTPTSLCMTNFWTSWAS